MKRTLSLLLCLTLLFGVSGFPAWADNLNVDSYYTLPESMTVDGVTITYNGQIMVSDEKLLSVLGDIDSAAARASLTIENAKLKVGGNFNADGNTPDLVILGCNGAEIKIDGDLRTKTSPYGTALAVLDGTSVEIGGSVIGNTGENNQNSWTIEAGSWSSGDMRPSYVRVGKDLKGNIAAYDGSTINVNGNAEGSVYASGEGASISIGDYLNGEIDAYNHAAVSVHGDVVSKVKAIKDGYVNYATAVIAQNGAAVTVGGSVSAINSDGKFGTAVQTIVIPHPWIEDEVLEGSHVEVKGNIEGNVAANGGSTVNIKGYADGEVHARGKGTSVSIGDYVKGNISALSGSSVTVGGYVEGTVEAWGDGAHVTIGNGVKPNIPTSMLFDPVTLAILAYDHARVDVTGDVDGTVSVSECSDVDISGNAKRLSINNSTINANFPTVPELGSTVHVGGDVSDGVLISVNADGTGQSKLTVEGTISSERNTITLNIHPHIVMDTPQPSQPWRGDYSDEAAYQKALEEYRQAQDDYYARQRELLQQARNEMNTAEGVQTIIDNLPQIIVGTLAPDADFVLVNGMMNQKNRKQVTEALLSQINYIVNMEGVDTANIAVYGYEELDGYLVAREQQKLTVKCINDNMVIATVSAGRYATIEENKDGSYTITVQRGGDLNLVVTARPKVVYASMDSDSGTNSAYDEAQWSGWLSNLSADYANRKLILDLRTVLTADIPYDTLRAYLADYGIGTLLVITENAEYTMTLSELLALAEEGDTFTFSVRDGALELAVNGSVVSTFSVE